MQEKKVAVIMGSELDKMREDMCAATLAKDAALQEKLNS